MKDTVSEGLEPVSGSLALLFTPAGPPFSHDSLLQGLLGLILYQEVSISLKLL